MFNKKLYDQVRHKKQRAKLLAVGLCCKCGKDPLFTKSMCSKCAIKESNRNVNKSKNRIKNGLCGRCAMPLGTDGTKWSCRQCQTNYNISRQKIRFKLKKQVMDHYGGKCNCSGCNVVDIRFLTIDHINSNGANVRKNIQLNTGIYSYKWIIKNNYPSDLQVLCWNCNCGRAHNNDICPHVDPI